MWEGALKCSKYWIKRNQICSDHFIMVDEDGYLQHGIILYDGALHYNRYHTMK